MFLRGIILGFWVFFSSVSWGAEICERLLKKTSEKRLTLGLLITTAVSVLEQNQPIINKKRFGSYAFNTSIEVGDRILAVDQKPVASNDKCLLVFIQLIRNISNERSLINCSTFRWGRGDS